MPTIVTHSGAFHADDIFAVAALLLIHPEATVIRSRDPDLISRADIAVDVGHAYAPDRMRFDHHQQGGAGSRQNAIPYASFGLVWKEFGNRLCGSEKVAQVIDDKLVAPIDALDNGVELSEPLFPKIREYTISNFFRSYISYRDKTEEALHEKFMILVGISKDLLSREIEKTAEKLVFMEDVDHAYQSAADKRLIILEKELPWAEFLSEKPEPIYVVSPRKDGNWGVNAVRNDPRGFENRKSLPHEWGGKEGDELARLTGVSDAVFCHRGLFLASARSKEGALQLAEIALNS